MGHFLFYKRPKEEQLLHFFAIINNMNQTIKAKLELLPDSPGCYLHKDKNGTVIYVGKAKNLKNRVRSYFHGSHNTKTELLVSEIEDLEWIVVGSNIESLVLKSISFNVISLNIILCLRMINIILS